MAPSVNSPLLPIVIPEIIVAPHFTCLGSGLLQNGHPRESPTSLSILLLPSPGSPRGIPNSAKSKTWWRAQCLHYGFDMPLSANIERMRSRLEDGLRNAGGLVVPAELLDLEHKKCGEFRKLNAQVREKVSGGGDSSASKKKATKEPKEVPKKDLKKVPKEAPKEAPKKAQKKAPKEAPKAVTEGAPQKAPKQPKQEPKQAPKQRPKKSEAAQIVTTTITTTTTTTMPKAAAAAKGRSGSGAGAAKAAKVEGTKKNTSKNSTGIAKPKPKPKPKPVKKEVKQEEGSAAQYQQQLVFLNSFNYTSSQGPLPSYLSRNQPTPCWQNPLSQQLTQGQAGLCPGVAQWTPAGDGSFIQHGAPTRGKSRRGRGRGVNHFQSNGGVVRGMQQKPPPEYGNWHGGHDVHGEDCEEDDGDDSHGVGIDDDDDDEGQDGCGDVSDGEEVMGEYEDEDEDGTDVSVDDGDMDEDGGGGVDCGWGGNDDEDIQSLHSYHSEGEGSTHDYGSDNSDTLMWGGNHAY